MVSTAETGYVEDRIARHCWPTVNANSAEMSLVMSEHITTYGVAELCVQKEITFEQLVERSGLDEQRVKAILLGRWTPSPVERKAIADVFEIDFHLVKWGHATPIQHIYGHGPG